MQVQEVEREREQSSGYRRCALLCRIRLCRQAVPDDCQVRGSHGLLSSSTQHLWSACRQLLFCRGITKAGVQTEMIDALSADPQVQLPGTSHIAVLHDASDTEG